MQLALETYSFPEGKTPIYAQTLFTEVVRTDVDITYTQSIAITLLYHWHPRYKKLGRLLCQRAQDYQSLFTHHKLVASYSFGEPL